MIYVTKDYANVFFINLKCGYSTFEKLCNNGHIYKLNKIFDNFSLDESILEKIDNSTVKVWLIMRCPYTRLCSFYKDKFINCFQPDNTAYRNQFCQRNIYKFVDIEKIENLDFTISEFIDTIKNGYTDSHMEPQSDILKCNIFNKDLNIIKFEDNSFNDICESIIGTVLPKENVTNSNSNLLNDSEREIIFNMYKKDFELYNSAA